MTHPIPDTGKPAAIIRHSLASGTDVYTPPPADGERHDPQAVIRALQDCGFRVFPEVVRAGGGKVGNLVLSRGRGALLMNIRALRERLEQLGYTVVVDIDPAAMPAPIVIVHALETGTLVYGIDTRDGAGQLLREATFRVAPELPEHPDHGYADWLLPHSRDKRAKTIPIGNAKAALEACGYTVLVEIDNVTLPTTTFAEREEPRIERAEGRAERASDLADRATARANARWRASDAATEGIPTGQPILNGHHSQRGHERALARSHAAAFAALEEQGKSKYWKGREAAATRYLNHREDVPATMRRLNKLRAQMRGFERAIGPRVEVWAITISVEWARDYGRSLAERAAAVGATVLETDEADNTAKVSIPAGPQTVAELTSQLVLVGGEIEFWEAHIAEQRAAGVVVWSKEEVKAAGFAAGDFMLHGGKWCEITRINDRSLSVIWWGYQVGDQVLTRAMADVRRDKSERLFVDHVGYSKITKLAVRAELAELIEAEEKAVGCRT